MFLNFDNIDISVNNSGILSTSASLNTNNSIEAAYILGRNRPINILPFGGIKTTFNTSYTPIISQEPNYAVVNKVKNFLHTSGYYGERVNVGGIYGENFFLENYSLKIQPNNIIEAGATYSTYWTLCGNLQEKSNTINYMNNGDIAHSWRTSILNDNDYQTIPMYDFNYNCKFEWQPIYVVGRKTPVDIKLMNIEEDIGFAIDTYRNILFTGENIYNNLLYNNSGNLQIKNLSLLCENNCEDVNGNSNSLLINIDGFKIKSTSVQEQSNEMVRVAYTAYRYR